MKRVTSYIRELLTESACGSRRVPVLTDSSAAISAAVRWRMNSGLPRHLKVTDLPSGMSDSLISILAMANTSAEALIEDTKVDTSDLAT